MSTARGMTLEQLSAAWKVDLRSPFPYFGGKLRVASAVWKRFGTVRNYVEPFAGSLAVLLARPRPFDGTETVNDLNGWLCNFWRALQADPDAVAHHADWPVSELDLHARGDWLFYRPGVAEWIEKLRADPDFYDAKSAGWWAWGQCSWIGTGWGTASGNAAGTAMHRLRPHLGDAGQGVNRKLPHLGNAGRGVPDETPLTETSRTLALREYLRGLAERLRMVRVCCGDWARVCTPAVTTAHGLTAVFLDPPYGVTDREQKCYGDEDSLTVSSGVRAWAIEHGDDPRMRIALCGYEGEHIMPASWECLAWKTQGGHANQRKNGTNDNGKRERVWFSPHCIKAETNNHSLFATAGANGD